MGMNDEYKVPSEEETQSLVVYKVLTALVMPSILYYE